MSTEIRSGAQIPVSLVPAHGLAAGGGPPQVAGKPQGFTEITGPGGRPLRLDLPKGGIPGVSNSNGVPILPGPSSAFLASAGIFALAYLVQETAQLQIETAQRDLDGDKKLNKKNSEEQLRKIEEWGRKCARIAAKMKGGGVFGMFRRLSSYLGMASGIGLLTSIPGVKMPAVKAALSSFAFLNLGTAILSDISRAAGGPKVDIDSLVRRGIAESLKVVGVKSAQAEAIAKVMGGVGQGIINPMAMGESIGEIAKQLGADDEQVMIVTAAFTVAAAIAQAVAMSILTGGSSTAASIAQVAQTIQRVSLVMQAMQAVDRGLTGIEVAGATRDASKVQAEVQRLKAMTESLAMQMSLNQEVLKTAYTSYTSITREVNEVLHHTAEGQRLVMSQRPPARG